jgi:hypothetical protein
VHLAWFCACPICGNTHISAQYSMSDMWQYAHFRAILKCPICGNTHISTQYLIRYVVIHTFPRNTQVLRGNVCIATYRTLSIARKCAYCAEMCVLPHIGLSIAWKCAYCDISETYANNFVIGTAVIHTHTYKPGISPASFIPPPIRMLVQRIFHTTTQSARQNQLFLMVDS